MNTSLIKKPLLAATLDDYEKLKFPAMATPKLDGIRALRVANNLVSRQFKPIRNETIRSILINLLPEGSDGEILTDGTFQNTTSDIMSNIGSNTFSKPFTFYWFDYVRNDLKQRYVDRMEDMRSYITEHPEILQHPQAKIIPLYPTALYNVEEILAYETDCLSRGFEGVMIRTQEGFYKMGRSTMREGILLKLKRFSDAEAVVIDIQELFHNNNDIIQTETGDNKRSQKKGGKSPAGKLGALVVQTDDGVEFNIGTGFTDQQRYEFWNTKDELIGKLVKFKYFEAGSKKAPRFPVFLGFRSVDDI